MFTKEFQKDIESFSGKISEHGYWVCNEVFEKSTLHSLLMAFESKRECLKPALIGKNSNKIQKNEVRNDHITWLKESEKGFDPVWKLLNVVKEKARSELFLPIKRFEAHVSLYPSGHFYKKHKDRHQISSSRLISSVLYFNDWVKEDAGELVIYKPDGREVKVSPSMNKVIFFKSELEHEVLTSLKERKSLTSWLRDDVN